MQSITLKIGGMHCVRCSNAITNALKNKKGIESISVSYATSKADIVYDSNIISYKEIVKIIKKSGYYVIDENSKNKEYKITLYTFIFSLILTIPFIIMMIFMFINKHNNIFHNGYFQLAFVTPIQFIVGYKFYKGAYESIKNKSPSMDVLVALGTSVAYFYSLYNLINGVHMYYFESCAFVITLVYLGKLLELKSKKKTNEVINSLINLKPVKVTVITNNEQKEIDVSELKVNDIFIVRNGENVASDGVIVSGESYIDESMLTGESELKHKTINDNVYGGTTCNEGIIEVRATKVGEETVLAGIVKMVEKANSSKAKVQKLADKISAIFVPSIIFVSILTFIINYIILKDISLSVSRAVAVLVVACPCSLGLATPTALIVGMGRCAKEGSLIKDADALEKFSSLKTIVMDKTGTITEGKLKISDVKIYNTNKEEFESVVSSLEEKSTHPLAKTIVENFNKNKVNITDIKEIPGKGIIGNYNNKIIKVGSNKWLGVESEDKTCVVVKYDDELVGIIYFSDHIKEEAKGVVTKLKENSVTVVLASGDNKLVCERVAKKVGIDNVYSEVLPSDKFDIIDKYKGEGIVAMVGDGINDAPSLANADVGIAMSSGKDIAIQSGDVVIMNNNLNSIYKTYLLSKATMTKIKQNLFWAFFYNLIGVTLAMVGILSPIVAGLAMSLSSVSVVSNSLLLNKKAIN